MKLWAASKISRKYLIGLDMDGIMNTYVHRYMKGYVSSLVTIGSRRFFRVRRVMVWMESGERGEGVRSLIEHNWVRRRHLL